ncbi:hypothetical protein BGZ76_007204 [Entomortierella beljakovae]|nr:hypothetical protein BGZ76_007204 [Entomortierella beljakovae]
MDHQPSLQDQSNITEPDTHTSTKLTLSPHKPPTAPYKEIILLETDFKEKFIKGGGNGGQKINKTNSNVELKHLETGIVVQCQATRALSQNRKLARKILIERLDEYYNGEMSKRGQKAEKIRQRKMRMARKSAKKYHSDEKMETDEANEGDDNEDYNEEEDTYEKKNNSRGNTSGAKLGKPPVPDINIQFTTLEEILSGDNKKISRRKAGRKE